MIGGRHLGKPGHQHHVPGHGHQKARAGAGLDLPDGDLEIFGPAQQGGVVRQGILGLGDDDGQLPAALLFDAAEVLLGLFGVDHPPAAVDPGDHGLDLFLGRGLQRIGVADLAVAAVHEIADGLGQLLRALAALGPDVAGDGRHVVVLAEGGHGLQLGPGVGGIAVDGHHAGHVEDAGDVFDVLAQVAQALFQGLEVLLLQGVLVGAAGQLEGLDGGHQHDAGGGQSGRAALDVHEFFGPQVGAEAGLGDHVVGVGQGGLGGDDAVAAVGDVGKGPAVDEHGGALQGLHQVGLDGLLQQGGHGPLGVDVPGVDGVAVHVVGHGDVAQALLQVGQIFGQTEDGHDLGGRRDVEARGHGQAVLFLSKPGDDAAQVAVVDVQTPPPQHLSGVDAALVALEDMVVHHGGQQVVGGRDGVKVAVEVEVDVLHGGHLGPASPGRAPLQAEHRAQRRLAQGGHDLAADAAEAVGQADGHGGLALPQRGGVDGGDQAELAGGHALAGRDLGLVAAVKLHDLLVEAGLLGHLRDGAKLYAVCDLDVCHRYLPDVIFLSGPLALAPGGAVMVFLICGRIPSGDLPLLRVRQDLRPPLRRAPLRDQRFSPFGAGPLCLSLQGAGQSLQEEGNTTSLGRTAHSLPFF